MNDTSTAPRAHGAPPSPEPHVAPAPPKRSRRRIWILAIVGIVVVVLALVGIKALQIGTMINAGKSFVPPPESVASATAQATEWEEVREAVGTIVAVRSVTVGAELPGVIREIGFESGAYVKKGQLLVKLDTSTEDAQLQGALADAELAKANLDRAKNLRQGGANTPADLDAAQARAKQTEAAVANLRATIAKKTIRAPFDGRVAIRQVELGQAVSIGTPIASIQSVTPVYADFWLPQQALADVKVGERARITTETFPGATWDGQISTINPEVDPATRNVRVRATFGNADGRLRPGMFVNVQVLSSKKHRVVIAPATAILYAPYGDSVFLIESKKDANGKETLVARQQFVRLGERRGDFVAITQGLEAGQRVVSAGAFKLKNGMTLVVNDNLAPGAQVAPKPTDQ